MTVFLVSTQSPSSALSVQHDQRTNTLAITCLPKAFFHPLVLDILRQHFSTYGPINQWVPLAGFGRILVVFHAEDDAETAKLHCDPIIVESTQDRSQVTLRVYRADPNPLIPSSDDDDDDVSTIPEGNYLKPPAIEKNFLISPPGSPPVGWEPIKEDPPNAAPLADDLMAALRKLQVHEKRSSLEVLLEPHEGAGVGVYVEDCDDVEVEEIDEKDWVYGETMTSRLRWRPVPTAFPPIHAMIA